jgi:CRP-like cAMP-binding protein
VQPIEAALGAVSLFAHLRPDEIGRIARHFEVIELEANTSRQFAAEPEQARLLVVVSGSVDALVDDPTGEVQVRMRPGDRYGDAMLFTGNPQPIRITARSPSVLGAIDRANFAQVLKEYPAVALPLSAELASELRARNDQVRQVAELRASGGNSKPIAMAVQRLRRVLVLRSTGVRRPTTTGLFRRLVIDQGAEPPFWMLIGFILGLCGARLVVHLILKYGLEKHFFALVEGQDANPMHIHHFNYGLILVGVTGVLALSPYGRRSLRALSMAFGLGCGLVVDEFALFWNLNPDYSQGLSLISAAIALVALVQVAYFRQFWIALFNRAVQRIRGE